MAYFNNTNNADFYSASTGSGEFDGYQFLNQTPTTTTEDANGQTHGIYADYWSTASQPGLAIGLSTSLPTTANYGNYHCSLSLIGVLRLGLQSRWIQPPRTPPS